jgi:hypothetical protein
VAGWTMKAPRHAWVSSVTLLLPRVKHTNVLAAYSGSRYAQYRPDLDGVTGAKERMFVPSRLRRGAGVLREGRAGEAIDVGHMLPIPTLWARQPRLDR